MTRAPIDADDVQRLQSDNARLSAQNAHLARERRELAEAAGQLDLALFVIDEDLVIRQQLLGPQDPETPAEPDVCRVLVGMGLSIDARTLHAQVSEVFRTGAPCDIEIRSRDDRWRRVRLQPFRAAGAPPLVSVGVADIDALKLRLSAAKEATVEAERIGRAQDDFLSLLSHELRTPLASVLMHAQLLKEGEITGAAATRAIAAIERGARAQVQMIDDLLDASRIVAGSLRLETTACDLVSLTREAVESVRPRSEQKRVAVECLLDASVRPVWGDVARIRKVIASIVGNAVKFTDPGGHVSVTLTGTISDSELRVRDEGCGIDPEFLPHVFDRLVQQDSTHLRKHGGLGLGLAIAKHIVTSCGGTLEAESRGRGKGATFILSLPAAEAAAEARESRERPNPHPLDRPGQARRYDTLRGLPILVVDDDAPTREAIVEVLTLSGAEVRAAESVADAMVVLERFTPRVLVSDIAMPGEDGYSFIHRLRKQPRGEPEIRAIALTALATGTDRSRARAAGFDAHVAKPVDVDRLRDAVASVLER